MPSIQRRHCILYHFQHLDHFLRFYLYFPMTVFDTRTIWKSKLFKWNIVMPNIWVQFHFFFLRPWFPGHVKILLWFQFYFIGIILEHRTRCLFNFDDILHLSFIFLSKASSIVTLVILCLGSLLLGIPFSVGWYQNKPLLPLWVKAMIEPKLWLQWEQIW